MHGLCPFLAALVFATVPRFPPLTRQNPFSFSTFFPLMRRGNSPGRRRGTAVFGCEIASPDTEISPGNSLFARNLAGDRRGRHCVASPECFAYGGVSRSVGVRAMVRPIRT